MVYGRSRSGWSSSVSVALALFALACGDDDGATARDAGSDAGTSVDAFIADTGAGEDDAGATDAGPPDAGGPSYDDPAAQSGTRLRRRFIAGSDGASMTTDFWDTELETACTFRTAADGALRCLPTGAIDVYFSDSGCTQPIYYTQTRGCDGGWATEREDNTMFRRTAMPAVLSGLTIHYRSGGTCGSYSISADDEFWVAELVTSASFVRGTRADESRTDGMVARFIEGEDGSRILDETVHGTRGYTCTFDEDGYCVIPPETIGVFYADATCTERIHPQYAVLPAPSMLTDRILDSRFCLSDVRYYERGAMVTAPTIYSRSSGVCAPQTRGTSYNFYRRGMEIPVSSLPRATNTNEGAGPIQARRWVDGDGAALETARTFWDTARDEECDPVQLSGGTFGCVPASSGVVVEDYFADAACSDTMTIAYSYCEASAPRLLVEYDRAACEEATAVRAASGVYERGTEVGPGYWFENEFRPCEMRTFSTNETGYRLGPDAASGLPGLELRTE